MTRHRLRGSDRFDALLAEAAANCLKPLESAKGLPPPTYSDPNWYAREMTNVFGDGWVAVARVEELEEPGSYRCATIGAEPVVVVRDRSGDLRALSNVCRHRGTVLVEGSGLARSLQCPHHGWVFRLDGSLSAAPHMGDGFSVDDICLPGFAVSVWGGWVFVNLSGDAPELGPRLRRLDEVLADEQLTGLVHVGTLDYPSPWNWKISVENFIESYHHQWVHPITLQRSYPGGQSFARHGDDEPWTGVDHVSVVEGSDPFLAAVVYPNLLFAVQRGEGILWFRLMPVDATSCHLSIEVFLRPELAEDGPAYLEALTAVNDEDVVINRATAVGLASAHAEAGPVSPLEETCWHFRRWLVGTLESRQ